ncbi:MAG: HD domain-containing protein [Desulfobacterales bacterium]|nr:HD domain-containing protein [Desulfobacterales bacterium]
MSLYNLTEFLKLSSALNYNLSAASLSRYNVMMFLIGGKRLDADDQKDREAKAVTMEALSYLFNAYRQKRRRLGPMAVLHPLRATAMYARSLERLDVVDLLTALFHDVLEDIRPVDFGHSEWEQLESQIYGILERLDPQDEWRLMERLQALTRFETESYYQYIGRMLDRSGKIPELVQVKLADRLDNTLDMRIELQDPIEGLDFFEHMFQLLFVNTYPGYRPDASHSGTASINGARRLYQLFKNAVLLSLIRIKGGLAGDGVSQVFFNAVCNASLKEAQRTLMHVTGYHFKEVDRIRGLLLDAMNYCYGGRIDQATKPDDGRILDGLFSSYFGPNAAAVRNQRLDLLYQNKPLMIEASVAFIVIFRSFLNDPAFYVRGISTEGIVPA